MTSEHEMRNTTKDEALAKALEELEDYEDKLESWAAAYPLSVFREPSEDELKKAHEVLQSIDLTMDVFSASATRHVATSLAAHFLPVKQSITACREALAQPAGERGELVSFVQEWLDRQGTDENYMVAKARAALLSSDAQPSEWVGVSDDEIFSVVNSIDEGHEYLPYALKQFARAIEAKLREKNARKDMPAANQCKPMGLEESVTDVRVCCGEYAKCHRACTPRGRWQATQEAAEDKAGGDEPVATGTWEHLKLMMEESAWDGKIELADALANIVDFEKYYTRPQPQADEPVALPCCGYADGSAIKWNPHNGVVQCHNCGQVYTSPQPQGGK